MGQEERRLEERSPLIVARRKGLRGRRHEDVVGPRVHRLAMWRRGGERPQMGRGGDGELLRQQGAERPLKAERKREGEIGRNEGSKGARHEVVVEGSEAGGRPEALRDGVHDGGIHGRAVELRRVLWR